MESNSPERPIEQLLVIGTGCAGVETALAARSEGWQGGITLIGDEHDLPYHRPPLSKGYLAGTTSRDALSQRTLATFENADIHLHLGVRITAIDRCARSVSLTDGTCLPYDRLVLATGGKPRTLGGLDHQRIANLHYLRTTEHADRLRSALMPGHRLIVIGGGYIGLEVAATAIKAGLEVTILESAPRVLARVTAPVLSQFYEDVHRGHGVNIRTSEQITHFELDETSMAIRAIHCLDGTRLPADLVVIGIGLEPNIELAATAGLEVQDGIVVNTTMQTADARIYAAGDCARSVSTLYERSVRVESVPNALEQARKIAALLNGKIPRPDGPPWFWSDQYDLSLKMVGLSAGYDQLVIRGSVVDRSFCAFYLQNERILAVDTVNRAVEFNLSKRLIALQTPVDPVQLADDAVPFKDLVNRYLASLTPTQP
ncbi:MULTISPECIES: NAD(P)/FAD-dependent oxidoreductase [Pseudomonas]|uniref:Pyridine nucleotide-disulfide oxidoreductase n=1 Tax=Pseudomonas monteilii TaxID=76759 RepID=A0AAE6RCV6_9PSED|nr:MULTISPECIES: FAD-dependent oxidoreductase [Pseudomonas]MDH4846096.1 pyridine nucleotide-disulfide oxidoreductase [Pseudomonas sp. BN605]MDH4858768.1 pyridine nucleotide-disulfide oxidoreductase [Pseudomonas sp. BN505]NWL08047.1 pyridine nucleotide-disulfide oxidoreductase [Pseudomonas hunanensis]QHB28810.1 pyridine nucleotide-disulfide oxidoreductase [Pseudomonas monteilii]